MRITRTDDEFGIFLSEFEAMTLNMMAIREIEAAALMLKLGTPDPNPVVAAFCIQMVDVLRKVGWSDPSDEKLSAQFRTFCEEWKVANPK